MADVGQQLDGDSDQGRSDVVVGSYRLDVGSPAGTSISLVEPESAQPSAGQAALSRAVSASERQKQSGPVEAVDSVSDDAEQVTDQVERGLKLWTSVAAGELDVGAINGEIDTLLAVLQKLDHQGRFEEQLRLTRALSRLLAIALRWVDLLRSLRGLLSAAERHPEAKAWALHELGTLHLAAGKHARAERLLGDARELREQLGDKRALAVTNRNLEILCRALRQLMRDGKLRERRQLRDFRQVLRAHAVLAITILFVMLGGGSAIAFLGGGGSKTRPPQAKVAGGGPSPTNPIPPGSGPSPGSAIPASGSPTKAQPAPLPPQQPVVTAIDPSSGSPRESTPVKITGTGLDHATAVIFGDAPAELLSHSDTLLRVLGPLWTAGTPCRVDVVVKTPAGQSKIHRADEFSYLDCQTTTHDGTTTGATTSTTATTSTPVPTTSTPVPTTTTPSPPPIF